MSTTPLRQELLKLAAQVPELRKPLLAVLNSTKFVPDRIARKIDHLASKFLASTTPRKGDKVMLMMDTPLDTVKGRTVRVPANTPGVVVGKEEMEMPSASLIDQMGVGAYDTPKLIIRFGRYGDCLVETYEFQHFGGSKGPRVVKMASAVIVGDIFVSSWGYDQTNVDFYQVVKTLPSMIIIREIEKQLVRGRGEPTEYVMPMVNKFIGVPLRKKVQDYQGRAYVRLNSFSSAHKWDGKPQQQTGGAYGR